MVEQMIRSETDKAAITPKKMQTCKQRAKTGKPGRPKGSKNRDKTHVTLTPELQHTQTMIATQLRLFGGVLPVTHMVLDGKFGNHPAWHMVRQCGLHLTSKLRYDAALYFPYDGPYAGKGPRRKYGKKIDYANIPARYLQHTTVDKHIQTSVYQAQMVHKEFAEPLNVVIIVKRHVKTHKRAHVVLFSSDLDLDSARLIDDYRLRCQIEFNFRDAKQYWGLEDFMNVQETAVSNAATLSLFMVNVASVLLQPLRQDKPDCGMLDLKAYFRGHKYVSETLQLLQQKPEPVLMAQIFDQIARLGSVHQAEPCLHTR